MKLKADFITNSSSTSYIICGKEDQPLKVKVELEIDLNEFVEERITTIEELDRYWDGLYYTDRDEEYEKYKKLIEAGNAIFIIIIDNSDGVLANLLYKKRLEKSNLSNFIILEGGDDV